MDSIQSPMLRDIATGRPGRSTHRADTESSRANVHNSPAAARHLDRRDSLALALDWRGDCLSPLVTTMKRKRNRELLVEAAVRGMNPVHCLSTGDVAELAHCSTLTVHRHVWAGRLKPVARRNGKRKHRDTTSLLFHAGDVLEWREKYPTIHKGRPKKEKQ